jgi:hypothetical protein
MSYRGIDRTRFSYLLSLGTDEFELSKFFSDCRLQLIHHGAKVQNLPHGHRNRIHTIAAELPRTTDHIMQSWFAKHVTMVDPEEAEAVVGVFKRYEEVGGVLPEDDARRYARSCLVYLFSEAPPHSILALLKTPIDGASKGDEPGKEIVEQPSDDPKIATYPTALPQVLIRLIDGNDVDEYLEDFPSELATFISGLQSAARAQLNEAREIIYTLPPESLLRNHLEQLVRSREARIPSSSPPHRGLQIVDLEEFDGYFDSEHDEVLGYCTKADQPSAVFVRPIAVVRGTQLQLLTDEKRRSCFPVNGDLISFVGQRYPRQPKRGEIGVWAVAEHPTEKATHFHLAVQKRLVHEVRAISFSSADHDAVREYLKDYAASNRGTALQPPLFQLNDGLIIGTRPEKADLSKDETFEVGLLSWNSLPAFRLDGRIFVSGKLPKEQGVYECASLASTVRKLFRAHIAVGKGPGPLTRAQVTELSRSLDDFEPNLENLRIQRIKAELENLAQHQEAFESVVTELTKQPDVKQRIDNLVEQEAARRLDQKTNLQAEIARLQKERADWEDRIRKEKIEHRKLRDETSKVVKAAFDKARAEGVSTLAEVAIFQALSVPAKELSPITNPFARQVSSLAPLVTRPLQTSDRDVVSILRSLGISGQYATAFVGAAETAHKAGLMVCVSGVAARPAVERWAGAIANSGVVIESTVGLVDDSPLREILAKAPLPDVLAILDANLSALDIYARSLLDLVFAQLSKSGTWQPLSIFLALSESVGALPLPKTFERVSVLLDLDAHHSFHGVNDLDELMSTTMNPEDGTLYARLWRPAVDRFRAQIAELEPEKRALVLSILSK